MRRGKVHLGRWLFNAAGAVALLFAAAAVAMWIRSHWATDSVWVAHGSVTAEVMTARNGCLFHWIGGRADIADLGGRRFSLQSTEPSDLVGGNWRFWTQSNPRRLLGVITWGRASYGGKGSTEWGMSILLPYWLLACSAAGSAPALLMISRRLHRRSRRRAGRCVRCGYDLRGNVSGVCPECGAEVARGSP